MKLALRAALATTTFLAPAAAYAQDATGNDTAPAADSGAIVVTAQRREQSVLDVPLAITAVSGESLASKGVTNSADLATVVPNLQVSSPYGKTQPNFSLRGISVANEYNSNQASPIGVYINDVYIANRTAHGMGLFDLDRVEVLRGPQGTLFGRNTTGGAINFITRNPSMSGTSGYIQAGYGNFNTLSGQFALEATGVEDELGVRLAGNYVKGDGQFRNVFPGGADPYSQDTLQGRLTIRANPNKGPVEFIIRAYGGRSKSTQAAVFGFLPFRAGLDFYEVNENRLGTNDTEAYGLSGTVKWELSPTLSFTSITSWDGGAQSLQQAADGSPLDILDITWKSAYEQWSEEARFNYTSGPLTLVAGGFYGRDRVTTDNLFRIGSALGPGVDGGFFQHYNQIRRSKALFAQGDYELTDALTLTLGARYTWDDADYKDGFAYLFGLFGGYFGPTTPLATTVPCPTPPGTCAYNPAARYAIAGNNKALTGRVALSYEVSDAALLYASYNRGYRSGAFNGGGYTSSAGINFIAPEKVNAYEIGAKGRIGPATYSLAGFYYDYSNQQVQDTRPGPVSFLVNAPKATVYGVELETQLRLSSMLRANLAAGYLDTKYNQLSLQGTVLDGNRLPFAPKFTLQAGLDIIPIDTGTAKLTISPSVSYFSQQWFSPFNGVNGSPIQQNAELQQKGYALANLTTALDLGRFTISAFANNVFEQEYLVYGLDLRGAGFPYNFLVPGTPRTYGAAVKVSF